MFIFFVLPIDILILSCLFFSTFWYFNVYKLFSLSIFIYNKKRN